MKLNKERYRYIKVGLYDEISSAKAISYWNNLPFEVVNVETVNNFKNAYDRYNKEMDSRRF